MADKMFDRLDSAANKAFQRVDKTFGFQSDPNLARYEQLKPADFDTIRTVYGDEGLADYISQMESRRIKGGG